MKKSVMTKAPAEQVVKNIRRATRKLHSSEENIRIVLSGRPGEDTNRIAAEAVAKAVAEHALPVHTFHSVC